MSDRQVRYVQIVVEGGKVIENMGQETNVFRIEFEETFTQDFVKQRGRNPGKKNFSKCYSNLGLKGISESKPNDNHQDNQVMDNSVQKIRTIWPENYDTIKLMQPKYLTTTPSKKENHFLKLKSKEFPLRNQSNRESPSAKGDKGPCDFKEERWEAGDKYSSKIADNSYETNSLNSGSEPEVSTQTEEVCEICARKRKMEEDPNFFTCLICR